MFLKEFLQTATKRISVQLLRPITKKESYKSFELLTSCSNWSTMMTSSTNTTGKKQGVLLGIGNPLLDITITEETSFLEKYKLKANDAIIANASHLDMFDEMIQNHQPLYLAGGATQNSIRIAQWFLRERNATTFIGGVGDDDKAALLRKAGQEAGVNVQYCVTTHKPTGVCGAVITGTERSLVAYLGAADFFTHEWLEEPEHWKYVSQAEVIYVGGFFFPVCHQGLFSVAEHCYTANKTFVMNLSAPFLCKYYADSTHNIMQYIDILFGNETEAATLCKLIGIPDDDLENMAKKVSELPKLNKHKNRTVVFTQGKDPIVVAHNGQVKKYDVTTVPKELIKDTNGCGDAFVGGFLSQLVQGKNIEDCIKCGMYASRVVIQHWGCNYDGQPEF